MALFDDISKSEQYQKYLLMIPEEQRIAIVENLRKLCEEFEQKVMIPIEILKKR